MDRQNKRLVRTKGEFWYTDDDEIDDDEYFEDFDDYDYFEDFGDSEDED
ncbi:hypothetical protein KY339_03285 [Candidatus Woesearchaeota archaeon]|nr:hypothetical protein [Candidatus Woesearchaeota archaeon]